MKGECPVGLCCCSAGSRPGPPPVGSAAGAPRPGLQLGRHPGGSPEPLPAAPGMRGPGKGPWVLGGPPPSSLGLISQHLQLPDEGQPLSRVALWSAGGTVSDARVPSSKASAFSPRCLSSGAWGVWVVSVARHPCLPSAGGPGLCSPVRPTLPRAGWPEVQTVAWASPGL